MSAFEMGINLYTRLLNFANTAADLFVDEAQYISPYAAIFSLNEISLSISDADAEKAFVRTMNKKYGRAESGLTYSKDAYTLTWKSPAFVYLDDQTRPQTFTVELRNYLPATCEVIYEEEVIPPSTEPTILRRAVGIRCPDKF